jgi:nicotinamide-nucleotide amidase
MRIATLSIGDEVILGEIVDTNAPWIASHLYDTGLKVHRHMIVGDVEHEIVEAIHTLSRSSDAVIATGGLGPTIDDLTARAAAKALDRRLVLNEKALEHLRDFFARRGRNVTPANEKQALIPSKSLLIPNPTGTACGFQFSLNGCDFYFLPGVPSEMKRMVEDSVIPLILESHPPHKIIKVKVLKIFGIPEAELDTLLRGITPPGSQVLIAFQVSFPEIRVKLRAEADNEHEASQALGEVYDKVCEILAGNMFAEDDETMESVVARLFRERGVSLSLAESCTGGYVAKRITDTPGSSAYFLQGVVTYSNASKTSILGIPSQLIEEKGAVSADVAMAMARGVRRLAGSDIALAITGIAGPDGGSEEKPAGTVYIALATASGCQTKMFRFAWDREKVREISTFTALNWMRKHLLSLKPK